MSTACSCALNEDLNTETFERYPFIAHVRFTKVKERNGPFDPKLPFRNDSRDLTFETIELYRGQPQNSALEMDWTSSCGTNIQVGEEWILFAYSDRTGQLNVASCTPTSPITDEKGQPILYYGYPTRLKTWLNDYCGILPAGVPAVGPSRYTAYYSNGKLREQTSYLNGEKNGTSHHYYANGNLMDDRNFQFGESAGLRRYYLETGDLSFELEFNSQGEPVRETNHELGYDDLYHEIIYTPEAELETDFARRADGSIARITKRRDWDTLEDKYFDRREQLIHHVAYDNESIPTVLLDSLQR